MALNRPLKMPARSRVCAGVDLGGTKIAAVLGTKHGDILAHGKIETLPTEGPTAVFERIGQLLERLAQEIEVQPDAIGIGLPGLVDSDAGIIEFLPNLPREWRGFPAGEFLRKQTGKQVYLLNALALLPSENIVSARVVPRTTCWS